MHLFDIVLFLHIAVVLVALFLDGVLHTSEFMIVRSKTSADALRMLNLQKIAPVYNLLVLLLIGLGYWLIYLSPSDQKFSFGDPFIYTALVFLAFAFINGPVILGRQSKLLGEALAQSQDGSITAQARALMKKPLPAIISFGNTFLVVAVVFDMATKPSLLGCVVVLLVGFGVGAAVGLWSVSRVPAAAAA